MEIRLAIRGPGRQSDHRHCRIAAINDHAYVRHALVADLGKHRIELHAIFNQRLVRIAAQAVLAADNVGDVMLDLGLGNQYAAGQTIGVTFAPAASSPLRGRLEELLVPCDAYGNERRANASVGAVE